MVLLRVSFPGRPWLGALVLMPLLSVALALPLAWLRERSGSVWPCVALHAEFNTPLLFMTPDFVERGVPPAACATVFALGLPFAIALQSRRER